MTLHDLLDREAIRECVFLYCRGIDRADEDALRASYWPDATDSHGAYRGPASGFIDAALHKLRESSRMIHHVGNLSIELRGSQAAVETYFLAWQRDRDAQGAEQETFLAGRYVDRFEKRGAEWRVAARVVVYDWVQAPVRLLRRPPQTLQVSITWVCRACRPASRRRCSASG